jgi:MFS family permease
MSLSIILLAWTFSPLIIAPLSEMYGREHISSPVQMLLFFFFLIISPPPGRWLYHISNLLTLAFSLGCAFAPTMGSFIGFRFLCEAQLLVF